MEKCKKSHKETDGEHFHVCIDWEEKTYIKFQREIITKQWHLKGQARDGIGRQYGKDKEAVGDEDQMITYMLKEQENSLDKTHYQVYTKEYLIERMSCSYKKEDKYTINETVLNHLKMMPCYNGLLDVYKIQITILDYWMRNIEKTLTKSTLNHITITFMSKHHPDRYHEESQNKILNFILGRII
jgi:hypothetical protein